MRVVRLPLPLMSIAPSRLRARLLAASLILLAGFGLRVYRLSASNIWWDEAWGVVLGRMPLAASLQRTASDEHPPLYYWSLHAWMPLAGDTPFAVRFPSVLAASLTLALLYQVGRYLGGAPLGLLAAWLLALNHSHITWSQQVKMYTLAAFFSLLSFWFLLKWFSSGRRRYALVVCGMATLAAVSTHYIALLVAAAQGLGGLWWGIEQARRSGNVGRRRLMSWVGLQTVVALLLIPWGAYLVFRAPHMQFTAPPPLAPALYLQVVATALTLGQSTHLDSYRPGVVFMLIVGAAWLPQLLARRPAKRFGSRVMALILVLPIGLIYTLSRVKTAELFSPKFDSRYLLLLVPPTMLALAWGMRQWLQWRRGLGMAFAVLVILIQVSLLPAYYSHRRATADFTTLMRTLNNLAQPQDGIVVYTDKDWPVFAYHNRTGLAWTGIPSRAHLTPEEVASRIDPVLEAHAAIWAVVSPDSVALDPNRAILARLAEGYPLVADLAFGDHRLRLYTREPRLLSKMAIPPEPEVRLDLDLPVAPGVTLIGYDLPMREISPGDYFPVNLYWAASGAAPAAAWRLQLLNPQGVMVREATGDLSAQTEFVHTAFPVSSAWAGGRYRLRVVVLPASAAGAESAFSLELASVWVRNTLQAEPPPERIASPLEASFDDVIWLEGSSALPASVQPGEDLAVTLYWRTGQEMSTNYTVFVHLVGPEFNPATHNFLWGQVDREPLAGRSRTSGWVRGQRLSDPYVVRLSADAPAGVYHVEAGLYDHSTGARLRLVTPRVAATADYLILGSFQVP